MFCGRQALVARCKNDTKRALRGEGGHYHRGMKKMMARWAPWLVPAVALVLMLWPSDEAGPEMIAPPDSSLSSDRESAPVTKVPGSPQEDSVPLETLLEELSATVASGFERAAASAGLPSPEDGNVDADWHSLPTDLSFVDAIVLSPTELRPVALHRCKDLNPRDAWISPDVRASIEHIAASYIRAIIEIDSRILPLYEADFARAEAAGSLTTRTQKYQVAPGSCNISIQLPEMGGKAEKSFERVRLGPERGTVTLVRARLSQLPNYADFYRRRQDLVAEFGAVLAAAYQMLGYSSSAQAEVLALDLEPA